MEQHPVPRNISSFQFHLIGDMTLGQFGYLAAAAAIAFIIYKVFPFGTIIKYFLIMIVAGGGFAFAFVPIQERPLDRWLAAFIKSIFSPTQYLWQKHESAPEILSKPAVIQIKTLPTHHAQAHKDAKEKLHAYLKTLPHSPHQTLNNREENYIRQTLALFNTEKASTIMPLKTTSSPVLKTTLSSSRASTANANIAAAAAVKIPASNPTQTPPKQSKPEEQFKKTAQESIAKPAVEDVALPQSTAPSLTQAHQNLEQQLRKLSSEKEMLEKELNLLKKQVEKLISPQIVKPEVDSGQKSIPTIKAVIPQHIADEIGMPKLPQTANLVMGVIKDTQRRFLPNIIITIKDNKGIPLRALKTNKLGQFITATPLANGTYFLEVEDPLKRYTFDIAQINLEGKVFLPIEIIAKGEKELIREKLTKELFGSMHV